MGAVVCLIVIPAVRIYLLVVSISDDLADIWLLLCYQVMQFFLIHKCISLPLCLLKLSIKELKIDFKSFFKKKMQEKSAPFGAWCCAQRIKISMIAGGNHTIVQNRQRNDP